MSLARKVRRANIGPKRAAPCIFCDEPRGSKEHFWPEWMHPLLPTFPNPTYDRQVIDRHPVTGDRRTGRTGAQGGVQTIRIRAVCGECNNGWMNRLEEAARPALTPLINGEAVHLEADQVAAMTRWIAMKCMVAEHAAENKALTPRAHREQMRRDHTIPPYYRIYAASVPTKRIEYRRESHLISLSPGPRPPLTEGVYKNIQTITFFMGHLFVHVNAACIDDFELEQGVFIPGFYPEARIWPPYQGGRVRRPVTLEGAALVASTLDAYLNACKVEWSGDMSG